MDVMDIPLWADCPWQERVPQPLVVRRGFVPGFDVLQIVISAPDGQHVMFEDDDPGDMSLEHMVNSIRDRFASLAVH